ncbi:MAG: L-glutamate gamma-semialdehyde dehydrogenase, partial [Parvularculaceae bacterium]|nr:L-glutamate gamma-semialdehyde dehydrogenase [Parvularculaceae bacterium]
EARALNVLPNPAIPAPRDLFGGVRLSAAGWDETDPDTATQLELAVGTALQSAKRYGPIVAGAKADGAAMVSTNPAHRDEQIGEVVQADADLVARACDIAAENLAAWSSTPAAQRGAILTRAADLLEQRAEHFMQLATREAGKTIPDAIAEIREAVDFLRYYGAECASLDGEPLGVVACISPWNFPLAIFLGQVSAALAAGNAVIAKPAEQTPVIAHDAVKLLHEAGVPEGVLHFLPGDGPGVGAPLTQNPRLGGVVFTGSTEVAQVINRSLTEHGNEDAALIAETGGINVMIVDSTALLEQAVLDVVASAFQSAGQRCSACRVVCVQEDIADRFNEMLAGAMAELAVGNPARLNVDVGPVIDEEAHANIADYLSLMKKTATIIAEAPPVAGDVNGAFIRPVAIEVASLGDVKREVFGPVLHVTRFSADRLSELVRQINALGFGLTMGVHTRIDETMHDIVAHARIGNTYVNRNQIGAVVGVQPFGGEGLSGTGPKAGGPHYLKALQKPPRVANAAALGVSASAPLPLFDQQMQKLQTAFEIWSTRTNRREILVRAAGAAGAGALADLLRTAAALFAQHFEDAQELPGPTGESNTLRLKGKGIALCLGGADDAATTRQIALCLAAGNSLICTDRLADQIAAAIQNAGGPADIAVGYDFSRNVHEAMLLDARIRLVVFDGDAASRRAARQAMARRTGAIIPLLTSLDAPWRFAAERTLTINTTAAGGDVRLLSLSD